MTAAPLSGPADQDRASQAVYTRRANAPERLAWYQDMALGMYLYWTVDAQFGMVNAHSVVGASTDYLARYFRQLPTWFNPQRFDADWYARLAVLCGFDYVTVTAKNHNGFCMWDTATTDFKVTNTPWGQDAVAAYCRALRARDLPVGLYFSPDDAWFQWQRGREVTRAQPYCNPEANPELLAYDQAQLRELIAAYAPDILCIDGYRDATASLVDYAWDLKPDLMITRGGIVTPEQEARTELQGPFEAHYTIGRQWQYRAGNDGNKTGRELIELLADIRARGGTLLLAIGGPDADGLLPRDKDDRVRELGLWMFINGEALRAVRPWTQPRQGNFLFTQSRDGAVLYAVDCGPPLALGEWRTAFIADLPLTADAQVEVLGASGRTLEYRPDANPRPAWTRKDNGLEVSYCRTQRLYNDLRWPNPLVLKISGLRGEPNAFARSHQGAGT